MARKFLSDRTLGALRRNPPKAGKRVDIMDTAVPGFGVRINDAGKLTFILNIRFPGDRHPSRRTLGTPGERTIRTARVFTLADARDEARRWRGLISVGTDPQNETERLKREAEQRRNNTFAAVAEDFIASLPATERRRKEVEQALRREFMKPWGTRPIVEITPLDVRAVIKATIAKGHPHQARNLLGHVRRLFSWAIAEHVYGVERSPCAELKPNKLIGKKLPRKRILDDAEIRAAWNAAEAMDYPYGRAIQLLILTGQRKSEITEACHSEIRKGALEVPAARMKSDEAHVIPLGRMARDLIAALPRFVGGGDFLFSTTFGKKPTNGFSKAKRRLDAAMSETLGKPVAPFVIHDIRRTVRTHLSALPIPQHICERIIGHAQPGLIQVYDRWSHLEEKRHGLELWEARLRDILTAKADAVEAA
jgi:integrase